MRANTYKESRGRARSNQSPGEPGWVGPEAVIKVTAGTIFFILTFSILTVIPIGAHHAFTAEFDADKPVSLAGPVTKLEWVNPHAWIHIDVTGSDGKVETWMIEAGSPNVLLRRGFNKSMLQIGTVIQITGFQAKGGAHKANGGKMTLPDGQTLLIGSTGTGAPTDEPKK